MANCVITSTAERILFDFNDEKDKAGMKRFSIARSHFVIYTRDDSPGVRIAIMGSAKGNRASGMTLTMASGKKGKIQVDTVDAATPTGNPDLFDKLEVLILH